MARIEIWREREFKDSLRAYQIELDGKVVEKINSGEIIGLDVQPGQHRLRLKIDWCSSPYVDYEIQLGQTIKFQCGSNAKSLLVLIYITFLRNKYLWLKRIG